MEDNDDLRSKIESIKKYDFKEKVKFLNTLKIEFGSRVVDEVDSLVKKDTIAQWQDIANSKGDNGIKNLVDILWEQMCKSAGFKFTVEKLEKGTQIKVSYCPLVDAAKELKATEWGYHFYCLSDYSIVEGFNSDIGFERTKTLMEGCDCCDHFYFMKKK
jgi:hypothetical protein